MDCKNGFPTGGAACAGVAKGARFARRKGAPFGREPARDAEKAQDGAQETAPLFSGAGSRP